MNTSNHERKPIAPQDHSDHDLTHEIALGPDQIHEAVNAHFAEMELADGAVVYVGRRSEGKASFSSEVTQKTGRYSVFTPGLGSPDRPLFVRATPEAPAPKDVIHPTVGALLTLLRHANNAEVHARGTQRQTPEYRERRKVLVEGVVELATAPTIDDEEQGKFATLVEQMQDFVGGNTMAVEHAAFVTDELVQRTRSLMTSVQEQRV